MLDAICEMKKLDIHNHILPKDWPDFKEVTHNTPGLDTTESFLY